MRFDIPPTPPILETERLILRPLRLDDAPRIQTYFANWEVVRPLSARIPWPYPDDGAETNVRESLEKQARHEGLCWAIILKDGEDDLIGRIDLRPDDSERSMRGFWLARPYWGQGLMTEAAEAVTAYAFDVLNWPHLYVTNVDSNIRSRRIKEKQDFELIDTVTTDGVEGPATTEVWRLTAIGWRNRHPDLQTAVAPVSLSPC